MVLKYLEFQLDSQDSGQSFIGNVLNTDWPLFLLGGKKPLENIAGFKIIEAQIPFAWYVVHRLNNTFLLLETGQADVVVTLNAGNYNAADFAVMLQSRLRAASLRGDSYEVVYDIHIQKFRIYNDESVSAPFSFKFGVDGDTGNTNPRLIMGFNAGTAQSQTFEAGGPAPNGNVLLAPNVCQVTGPNYVYVNSASIGTLTDMYLPKGALNLNRGNSGPQVTKIPVTVQPGGVIYWADPDPEKYFDLENLANLSQVDFYLTLGNTSAMTPLELNGASFSLKIGLLVKEGTTTELAASAWQTDRVIKRIKLQ